MTLTQSGTFPGVVTSAGGSAGRDAGVTIAPSLASPNGTDATEAQAPQAKASFWKRSHYLDRMTLAGLIRAYFQHYTIAAYLGLSLVCLIGFALAPTTVVRALSIVGVAMVAYPLVWHLLHQYVLHGQWMYRIKPLAATWKRIHYDHHQDPNHLEVLFGALHTTLPTLLIAIAPLGALIGGPGHRLAGAALAFAAGMLITCYYEFMHCIQHLAFKPKWKWVQVMKQRHNEHHYSFENGNFGITNYMWDRILGTYYEKKERPGRSPTVFNLGYTEEIAARWPWVKALSGGVIASGHPRRRALGKEGDAAG